MASVTYFVVVVFDRRIQRRGDPEPNRRRRSRSVERVTGSALVICRAAVLQFASELQPPLFQLRAALRMNGGSAE
jgi:hypothetical protein